MFTSSRIGPTFEKRCDIYTIFMGYNIIRSTLERVT